MIAHDLDIASRGSSTNAAVIDIIEDAWISTFSDQSTSRPRGQLFALVGACDPSEVRWPPCSKYLTHGS